MKTFLSQLIGKEDLPTPPINTVMKVHSELVSSTDPYHFGAKNTVRTSVTVNSNRYATQQSVHPGQLEFTPLEEVVRNNIQQIMSHLADDLFKQLYPNYGHTKLQPSFPTYNYSHKDDIDKEIKRLQREHEMKLAGEERFEALLRKKYSPKSRGGWN